MSFETEQVQGPKPPVVFQPAIQIAQRFGVQPVDAIAAFTDFGDELRGVQYAKVFGDGGTADVEASGDLVDGLSAVTQAVQNGAARGVGDGVKNSAVLRNHFVTCFVNGSPHWLICNRMVTSIRPKDTLRQEENSPARKLSSWEMRLFLIALSLAGAAMAQPALWTEKAANEWYAKQPWLVGSNYLPATAINQLEMWQADTFDPVWIDTELNRAEGLGMNTMRVFLHDLPWKQDSGAFQRRIDKFLSLADKHKIRPIFVLFDSCWDPFPQINDQRAPKPGVHNSGWVQSPGAAAMRDPGQTERLRQYVQGVIGAYRYDKRVLAWDLWNEPDNLNDSSYKSLEPPNKIQLVQALLPKVFQWARAMDPLQPLTSGVWKGDWSSPEKLSRHREDPAGAERRDFVPQLRWAGGI